jgi:hypothetical protein
VNIPSTPLSQHNRFALWLYSIAGGVALGYEEVWSQSIVQFMSTRTYAFAVVLAAYLTGLFIGSALLARRVERIRDPWGVFGLLTAGAGFSERMETHRQRLMQFYRTNLDTYDGDRDAWARDIREVMRGDGGIRIFAGLPGSNSDSDIPLSRAGSLLQEIHVDTHLVTKTEPL